MTTNKALKCKIKMYFIVLKAHNYFRPRLTIHNEHFNETHVNYFVSKYKLYVAEYIGSECELS